MTEQEIKIGNEWLAILNAHSNDFATKSLFNQTAAFLKAKHGGGKRVSKFQREQKVGTILTQKVEPKPKPISLLEAAKLRAAAQEQEDEEQDGNILAMDETGSDEDFKEFKQKKPKK
jgi:hypothetical protein